MKYSSIPSARSVVHHCKARGIKNIIISPGSRNAPLTISFYEDPFFKCFSIVDERSAAFFALGIAQQLMEPTVVLCTSGSALLNYYPAIAEAFYSDIPLIVLSADRPRYKVDIGDGQTIRQENVFDNHIGYSANLMLDICHATDKIRKYDPNRLGPDETKSQAQVQKFNDAELEKAMQIAISNSTPVHINIPFEEPLYQTIDMSDPLPQVNYTPVQEESGIVEWQEYLKTWQSSSRKMVLVGVNPPNAVERQYLDILAKDPSVIVLTESTSNLFHPNFFPNIDSIIAPIEKSGNREQLFKMLQPEIVLTFGGLIVSKKIKAFLRGYSPVLHWHVDTKKANNTFFCLKKHFKTSPNDFFKYVLEGSPARESGYYAYWAAKKVHYKSKRKEYLSTLAFSDMLVFHEVLDSLPKNYQLQLSNSSTVRYAQLFDLDPSIRVFCNRGTSGIDGSTSTAVGASIYDTNPTLLVTGDLSFLYDSNGLWNNYIKPNFRIIVINNDGGGIFRILPGKEESSNFNTFFETTHNIEIRHLAEMYKFGFESVSNKIDLKKALDNLYKESKKPKILEIKTPRLLNDKILLSYFDFIS
ncbi:2-succinyl-5-enolpyruvyl-6-hydroxy-3-cyclohexene-1-carboxylic-acid synthase [Arenibacter sp. TNZ]|jgi:2-succinyl-5-enolpyruvyl-6-hydroxy-3-cyclohexene-1-carboxylate synthase|uniref:2-succinyl-5-enolpyruvyl-6-hydroxy-3- cyclohexene-1-carboxylic-acid synthase n=1 Tax=Arenibacter TaxID=178469 RepID=UPI000CD4080A|nr:MULTISPECIES: 2-succinyl-5-enolpyruvyl-6-hydroxy-3-cyclohexene-1-carboxylic-acid synthase [Arenibacter]MCM4171647.1 2-succinyl-5-enolpyruvyl-6-hydroxy-3-cyclohexene-1-carboxylic-acid synthase [Arenibacter sp. TNZ]